MNHNRTRVMWSRLLASAMAAILIASSTARAETLIMKDGTRVPCRILARTDAEVTIRNAKGSEITYPMSDIASIDEDVSLVEVYEGVAEQIEPNKGCLPYYLALWVVEVGTDRKGDAEKLLDMAARDPAWRGHAFALRAKIAEDDDEARSWMRQALNSDPTLNTRGADIGRGPENEVAIPKTMLTTMAHAVNDFVGGRFHESLKKLRSLEGTRNKAALSALDERMTSFTGMSISTLRSRASSGARHSSVINKARESRKPTHCGSCGSTGYLTCSTCQGTGFVVCKNCSGSGTTTHRVRTSNRTAASTKQKTCRQCAGKGGRACPVCLRIVGGGRQEAVLQHTCPLCEGRGTVVNSVAASQTAVSARMAPCGRCGGTGEAQKLVPTSASGIRRCMKCNRDGLIPRPGQAPVAPRVARQTQSAAPKTPVDLLGEATLSKVITFGELAQLAMEGRAGYRWRSGSTLPLFVSPGVHEPDDGPAFACGKWVDAKRAAGLRRRAKILGQKPRRPDTATFVTWMDDRVMQQVEASAIRIGTGPAGADEVRGMAAVYDLNRRIGKTPSFDAHQIFKSTFLPSRATKAKEVVCQWKISRQMGAPRITFCMLNSTGEWPELEIVAHPTPGVGVDVAEIAKTVVASARLNAMPLTIYYRVRGCIRTSTGSGDSAGIKCTLEVEPVLVGAGRGGRAGLWTTGGQQLASK